MHCATSFDELAIGQHVHVVLTTRGETRPGVVRDFRPNEVQIKFVFGARSWHRPYEILIGGPFDSSGPVQGELFGITELFEEAS
ncbi:hypothetical protein C1Y40_04136 [Mycobacterium talmoniae]|uniref:Uncharacterized protein n=1 Tax=Mycobacterium talmoniae TaxID=1858794 RepID=A0A2S8BG97_9MYCO|nr:hypothetical protein C1Y40_04136 [Mycobacterium talmoniae]